MRKHAYAHFDTEVSSWFICCQAHARHAILSIFVTIVLILLVGASLGPHLVNQTLSTKTRQHAYGSASYVAKGSSFEANVSIDHNAETINSSTITATSALADVKNRTFSYSSDSASSQNSSIHITTTGTKPELGSSYRSHTSSPTLDARSTASTDLRHINIENYDFSLPRLALCIAGNARTFHYPMVHKRIIENVVHPLRTVANVDIFFIIKLNDNPRPLHPRSPRESSSTRAAMAKFRPVSIRELGPDDDILHGIHPGRYHPVYKTELDANNNTVHILTKRLLSKPLHPSCDADPASRVFVPYALHRTHQCLSEIRSYEAAHRYVTYKYLYRIRPDVVFLDVIPMPMLLAPRIVITNAVPSVNIHTLTKWLQKTEKTTPPDTGDHFLAALTDDADIAFSAVNGMHDCKFFKLPILRNPEAMLLFWLLTKKLTPITPMVAWVLVREDNGPECKRVQMLKVTNSLLKDAMVRKCEHFKRVFQWSKTDSS